MNGIPPTQVNPLNFVSEIPEAQQRPSVEAVRALAKQTREQARSLIPLLFNADTILKVLPQAQALAASASRQLKHMFLEPNEDHADLIRKLEGCADDVRHNAREVIRFAISLHQGCLEALEIASHLLENGPSNLLVTTRSGPLSLSKDVVDTALLYHLTGDEGVLQGPQPEDQANLAALHAEWARDDAIDPYAPQR